MTSGVSPLDLCAVLSQGFPGVAMLDNKLLEIIASIEVVLAPLSAKERAIALSDFMSQLSVLQRKYLLEAVKPPTAR